MKTLKYRGKEYVVLDIFAFEATYTVNLDIVAAIKDGSCIDTVQFHATYFKNDGEIDIGYQKNFITSRLLNEINKFAKAH